MVGRELGLFRCHPFHGRPGYWRVRNELSQWLSSFIAVELFQMKTCSLKYRAINRGAASVGASSPLALTCFVLAGSLWSPAVV